MAHDTYTRPDRRDPFQLEEIDDPFMEDYFSGVPAQEAAEEAAGGKPVLPGSNTVLLLGIMSIPLALFLPPLGFMAGGLALWSSGASRRSMRHLPDHYAKHSISNLRIGRRCATGGIVIGGIVSGLLLSGLLLGA